MTTLIIKQAHSAKDSAFAALTEANKVFKAAKENMESLLGAVAQQKKIVETSGNEQDKAALKDLEKKLDMAIKAFKAANKAQEKANKMHKAATDKHTKLVKEQDAKAAKEKADFEAKTKAKQKAAPLTEKAARLMVVEYVGMSEETAELGRQLDTKRKDNTAKLKACAAAIPSQDRLIAWSLEIIKAAFEADKTRKEGEAHKTKDKVAALKRLGAAYIVANEATMGGLEFVIKALGRTGNYEVKFTAKAAPSEAEEKAKAEKQAAKDWAAFVELGAKFGLEEAALIALKAKVEAEKEAAFAKAKAEKAAKLAARKAAKLATKEAPIAA